MQEEKWDPVKYKEIQLQIFDLILQGKRNTEEYIKLIVQKKELEIAKLNTKL